MSQRDTGWDIRPLDGSNWLQWKPAMMAFLRVQHVWKYVDGSAIYVEDPIQEDVSTAPVQPDNYATPPAAPPAGCTPDELAAHTTALAEWRTTVANFNTAMQTWRVE